MSTVCGADGVSLGHDCLLALRINRPAQSELLGWGLTSGGVLNVVQLYQSVPQVLLPVVPHLTSELQSGDGNKRLEAVQLLCKLFSLPGSKLVSEYEDVLEALLSRYQDTKVGTKGRTLRAW